MGNIVELQVEGMDCAACEQRLQTVLGRLDGVGHVAADHTSGRVRLRFDPGRVAVATVEETATERIETAGFTVTGSRQDQGAR
jgi:copper chaperone